MTIARVFILLLMVSAISTRSYAQKQSVDFKEQFAQTFAGTWKFNPEKSAKNKSLARFEEWTMQISQVDGVIKIVRTIKVKGKARTDELTYYPDGRGEENPTGFGPEKRETKTIWSDNKLLMKFTLKTYAFGDFLQQDIVDSWEVSNDGQTLNINTEAGKQRGSTSSATSLIYQSGTYQKVFDRIQQ